MQSEDDEKTLELSSFFDTNATLSDQERVSILQVHFTRRAQVEVFLNFIGKKSTESHTFVMLFDLRNCNCTINTKFSFVEL